VRVGVVAYYKVLYNVWTKENKKQNAHSITNFTINFETRQVAEEK
jgi:hypothetical protein